MTILEMLNRLAEKAPDVCQPTWLYGLRCYAIAEYAFWQSLDGFSASYDGLVVRDRPALAWLADAIMGECEKRNISFEHTFWTYDGKQLNRVHDIFRKQQFISTHSYAEALLTAFLAVMEGER